MLWVTLPLALQTILSNGESHANNGLMVVFAKPDQVGLFRYADFESCEKMLYKEQFKVGIQSMATGLRVPGSPLSQSIVQKKKTPQLVESRKYKDQRRLRTVVRLFFGLPAHK